MMNRKILIGGAVYLLTALANPSVQAEGSLNTISNYSLKQFPTSLRQELIVKGTVRDQDGSILPGVSVTAKGNETLGTMSDDNGNFLLEVPDANTILVFRYVGYRANEVTAAERLEVTLTIDDNLLDEVVVVGYGTQRRRDITGAVATVSSQDYQSTAITNVGQALQGRTAGVQVAMPSGRPGNAAQVRVRGVGTLGNSNPIYVIDGQITEGGITHLNPDDIENMSILKDAAASAIYGSRAANGVVMITTKRGKAGAAQVSFNAYYGLQQISNYPDMLDAQGFATLQNEARENAELNPHWEDPASLGVGHDRLAMIFRTAPMQNYHTSISGGSERSQYAASLGFMNQEGIGVGSDYKRYSASFNSDHQITKIFNFGNSLMLTRGDRRDGIWRESLVNSIRYSPTIPKYFEDGSYAYATRPGEQVGYLSPLPLSTIFDDDESIYRVLGNVYAEFVFNDYLKFKSTLGIDYQVTNSMNFDPTYAFGTRTNTINRLWKGNDFSRTWLNENTLSYDRTFQEKHELSALVGLTAQENYTEYFSAERRNLPNNDLRALNAASTNDLARGGGSDWSLLSFLARVNYIYNDKYLFSANFRADGSSRFGPDNRYGYFPSFSAGWRIKNEAFMQDLTFIDDMKIRASWGQLGNQEIGLYSYANVVDLAQNYVFGQEQGIASGAAPITLGNRNVRWETTQMSNIGIDFTLFNGKLDVVTEYFIKDTKDMLLQTPVPLSTGIAEAPYRNVGKIRNQGFELSLIHRGEVGELQYQIGGNLSTLKNRVIELAGLPVIDGQFRSVEGRSIRSIFGFIHDGIFQTQEEVDGAATQPGAAPGDIRWRDLNGDGVINDADRDFIGNTIPTLNYGFNASLNYKGFDMNIFFQGVSGNDIYLGGFGRGFMHNFDNSVAEYLGRWTGPGTSDYLPRMVWGDPASNGRTSNFHVFSGSYLRLRNAQLGYTLSNKVFGLNRLRLYVSGENLLTFTKYPWFDPEVVDGTDNNFEEDMTYPLARTFMFGVNVTF
ncbi:TonB-dependent receptor [Olivibacter sp. SDN3]|uniref:SusC/RagA family TonB-linked outer membrane protein n=1 Tax=Olivibacter sp. SDN3 TaxID=2764720 RepID=UPI001651A95B|nr:TonB-dependent receptor [Olivibacter sp. SDN3]QNL48661.1 TonB-dependent receptor [Olivibacter sp. SDN3]